jgi:hypothetical protein
MASQNYPRVTIEDFGKHLLDAGDLDPIYLGLHRLALPANQLHRWLLAYCCFYSAGVASYLSEFEGATFWEHFLTAAKNETPAPHGGRWERGKERRHFRGGQAIKATNELIGKYPVPELAFNGHLVRPGETRLPFSVVSDRAQEWRGFGTWISFKVGDLLDRVGIIPVDFAFDEAMYEDPTKAAIMQWKLRRDLPQDSTIDDPKAAVQEIVAYLIEHFKDYLAPPLLDRPIGLQEVETILCKWKSHINGHYPFFNDTVEIHHGVSPWANHSDTAKRFLAAMPQPPAK